MYWNCNDNDCLAPLTTP